MYYNIKLEKPYTLKELSPEEVVYQIIRQIKENWDNFEDIRLNLGMSYEVYEKLLTINSSSDITREIMEYFYNGNNMEYVTSYITGLTHIDSDNLGDGNRMEAIFHLETIEGDTFYFKCTGTYSSWDSSEWYAIKYTKPKEVTVIEFI